MTQTVYIKLNQITQVHKKDVFLSDIATVICSDKSTASRCRAVKVRTIHSEKKMSYVGSVTDIITLVTEAVPGTEVNSVGEQDFIIAYDPNPHALGFWQDRKSVV